LVERYGCIVGYPNSTFRGNRAATRFELAAALNACLDVISDRFATKEDLLAVRRLQEEFAKELATLKGRINNLEGRTAKLEAQQFSTTTKLRGVAVFSFSDALLGTDSSTSANVRNNGDNPIVSYRVRLNLDTSFSGKDLLRTRLQAGNVPNYNSTAIGLYNTSRLSYDTPVDNGTFTLDKLYYRFPIFGKGMVQVDALRAELYEGLMNTYNPYLASADTGSLSRFFRFNPIYFASGDAGVTFSYPVLQRDKKDYLRVTVGYHGGLAVPANAAACTNGRQSPSCFGAGQPQRFDQGTGDGGLFGGPYSASAQVEFTPLQQLRLGLLYTRTYGIDVSGATGSALAANPFGSGLTTPVLAARDQSANNFGFQFACQPIKQLSLSGWVGYSNVTDGSVSNGAGGGKAEVLNWAFTAAAPDLWRKGDVAAISFGMPPRVISGPDDGPSTTYMLQALYRFQVNPNISVTPGIIAVFNPNSGLGPSLGTIAAIRGDNETILMGVLRTTFTF
jgi:hypothetical protein